MKAFSSSTLCGPDMEAFFYSRIVVSGKTGASIRRKTMHKVTNCVVSCFFGMVLPVAAMAADNVFVTVNGKTIMQSYADTFVDIFVARQMAQGIKYTPKLRNIPREAIRDGVIRNELILQEAKKAGIDKRADVAKEVSGVVQYFKQEIEKDKNDKSLLDATEVGWKFFGLDGNTAIDMIFFALLAREAKNGGIAKETALIDAICQLVITKVFIAEFAKNHQIGEAQLKARYDTYKADLGDIEYKVRHILLKDRTSAQTIINDLKKGANFADLSRKHSIDNEASDDLDAGALGWHSPSQFPNTFAVALRSLVKGRFTETPVQTDAGYHVILVEDTRPLTVPPLDEIEPKLIQEALSQQLENMVQELRSKAKIY